MTITVGGLMVFFGWTGVVLTVVATLLALFSQGMSDSLQDRFNWWPTGFSMAVFIAVILVGKFSGI